MSTISAGQLSPRAAWAFLAAGVALLAAATAAPPAAAMGTLVIVAIGSIAAIVTGYRRQTSVPRPWQLMAAACGLFLIGLVLRALVPAPALLPVQLAPSAFSLFGYLFLAAGLLDMLRLRRDADGSMRLDATLVGLASGLVAWTFLISPTLAPDHAGPPVLEVLDMAFPAMDVLLTGIVAQLVFSTRGTRSPALWLLAATMVAIFAGDLLYALHVAGAVSAAALGTSDLLFLVAYVTLGASALHPSMRVLTDPPSGGPRPVGPGRVLLIAAALLLPVVLAIMFPPRGHIDITTRLTLSAALTVAVAFRTVRAANNHARAVAAARRQATHDPLTGLPNRALLAERVTAALAADPDREVAVLFADLDGFKLVNDSWGHSVGDELLIAVSARLQAAVRERDLVCRFGGDEFVVVLSGRAGTAAAPQLANRLLATFAEPFQLSVGRVVVSPSIGIASASASAGIVAEELVRDADIAMYKAKTSGRGGYAFFDESLREQAQVQVGLEQAMRTAVDRGEMEVYYQPIVDLGTDELVGFEALLRWNSPELGPVSPEEFIPVAEKTGLIVPIGAWTLQQATRQAALWHVRRGGARTLHVSVNIAAGQLQQDGFADVVRAALAEAGLAPSALWLEITESAMIADPELAGATLRALRDLGVEVAVDDFGTGYSALGYLKRFPVGVVKIDRSFISGLGDGDVDSEEIVRAVVAMSHAIALQVVAEGVETPVQRELLRVLGCDMVQGYLFGRPRSASATLSGHDRWLADLV